MVSLWKAANVDSWRCGPSSPHIRFYLQAWGQQQRAMIKTATTFLSLQACSAPMPGSPTQLEQKQLRPREKENAKPGAWLLLPAQRTKTGDFWQQPSGEMLYKFFCISPFPHRPSNGLATEFKYSQSFFSSLDLCFPVPLPSK